MTRDPSGQPAAKEAVDLLVQVGEDFKGDFQAKRRLLSFEEYFALVAQQPRVHLRDAASYVLDTFDHYGTTEVRRARGKRRRFKLFDAEFAGGRDRLAGHEEVQNAIYSVLASFVRLGRPNKLILLHGPNGSAKSTCVAAIARAMEHYSRLNEGALYRFNWIFPSGTFSKGSIGFGSERQGGGRLESYAHLPEELMDARLPDELRDHPLLLVPKSRRAELLEPLLERAGGGRGLPDSLRFGELSHRNREIFEALLVLYHGDYHAVLRHVQVERFFLSRRYRTGLLVVEPKLSVDARTQQITMDRSVEALPPALKTLSLFRYSGELVEANRGIVEFADLLKRPIEAFKYLINTVEHGRVGLDNAILYLDEVFLGSTNDLHLRAFREIPDFPSFKGRIELVRVGYLTDLSAEMEIYWPQMESRDLHVAPHAVSLVALFGVMSRLRPPDPEGLSAVIQPLVERLNVLEKARLYDDETLPDGLEGELARQLRAAVPQLATQGDDTDEYEGYEGASPRELRMVLLAAAQSQERSFLSPLAVFEELEKLVRKQDVYAFLRRSPRPGGYFDARAAIQLLREDYLERLRSDFWDAAGLVPGAQIDQQLQRYVEHVSHFVKGEKLKNQVTGAQEDPDQELMSGFEGRLGVEDPKAFRRDVMARIASWAMEHKEQRPRMTEIFAKERQQIVQSHHRERQTQLKQCLEDTLLLLGEQGENLASPRRSLARETLDRLIGERGYRADSLEEAIRHYLGERFS
ncbi:MAG: serine protein kinase PrkA [Polyangia bacterium]|jgi:predicted Ser/Thr protein kinase|nr:serine protein kinase PrkA [Polyangia bacterium]